jgi:hypothetical protein
MSHRGNRDRTGRKERKTAKRPVALKEHPVADLQRAQGIEPEAESQFSLFGLFPFLSAVRRLQKVG